MLDDLVRRVGEFAAREAPALAGLGEEAAARAALAALAREELLGWTVPARDGGIAAPELCAPTTVSVRALARLRDELAYHSGMLDVMFVMQGLGSYPLALGGRPELRAEVLPDVARGARVAGFALTEPGAGSNLAQVVARAERTGTGYLLHGHKTFISNAGLADFYTVLARTSGEEGDGKGLSMFYVPASSRGVEAQPFEVIAPHPIGDVRFAGVEVPAANLIGEEGRGMELALATLARFRTSVAAAANGFARRALYASLGRLAQRNQFGRPLSANQALRFDLAEMDVRLRAAQLLVVEAARAVDEGGEAVREVARAKLFATENAGWICDRAVQHFGGLGVKRGEIVERLYREVRALRIYEGTSEIQKLIIAKDLLDGAPGARGR